MLKINSNLLFDTLIVALVISELLSGCKVKQTFIKKKPVAEYTWLSFILYTEFSKSGLEIVRDEPSPYEIYIVLLNKVGVDDMAAAVKLHVIVDCL